MWTTVAIIVQCYDATLYPAVKAIHLTLLWLLLLEVSLTQESTAGHIGVQWWHF